MTWIDDLVGLAGKERFGQGVGDAPILYYETAANNRDERDGDERHRSRHTGGCEEPGKPKSRGASPE